MVDETRIGLSYDLPFCRLRLQGLTTLSILVTPDACFSGYPAPPSAVRDPCVSCPAPAIARAARYLPKLRLCTCLWSTVTRDIELVAPTVEPVKS